MNGRTDDFTGLRSAIARAGLAVLAFGVFTALPLLGEPGAGTAGSTRVAQAGTSHDTPASEDTSCEI
jgi:hypothetical protein